MLYISSLWLCKLQSYKHPNHALKRIWSQITISPRPSIKPLTSIKLSLSKMVVQMTSHGWFLPETEKAFRSLKEARQQYGTYGKVLGIFQVGWWGSSCFLAIADILRPWSPQAVSSLFPMPRSWAGSGGHSFPCGGSTWPWPLSRHHSCCWASWTLCCWRHLDCSLSWGNYLFQNLFQSWSLPFNL